MDLWELMQSNLLFRWFIVLLLTVAAIFVITALTYSPNGPHIPGFNDLFPPAAPRLPMNEQERLTVLRQLSTTTSSSAMSAEERTAALQSLEPKTSDQPDLTDEERARALDSLTAQ